MTLARSQKAAVVAALMSKAGDIAEFWSEHPELADVPVEEGVAYLAALLKRLPGEAWDRRLGKP